MPSSENTPNGSKIADVQIDEIWSFCGCKEKNRSTSKNPQVGDVWTWTTLCRETKLTPTWLVGDRSYHAAREVVGDLSERLCNRVQIRTDGNRAYISAVQGAFGSEGVDYGRLVKVYGQDEKGNEIVIRADKVPTLGNPDQDRICTSHVERQNLTMRMGMRRFTRLTNGFSKKLENHAAMIGIHFLNYNFVCKHQTIKTAPAVAAGVIDKPLTIEDLCEGFNAYRDERYPVIRPKNQPQAPGHSQNAPQAPETPWYLDPDSNGRPGVL